MWLWLVLLRASVLLFANATLNFDYFPTNHRLEALPSHQMNCYIYSRLGTHRFGRVYNDDWRSQNYLPKSKFTGQNPQHVNHFNTKFISRRFEHLAPKDDLVKEHAKLVQDINSLKQYVFVAPFEDNRDYDESIYHEIIETTTFRPAMPAIMRTGPRPVRPSFPVILLGGENTHHVVKTPYQNPYPKATINLVGTTSSPLKHPYPFVMKPFPEKPLKLCMPSLPPFPATTRRPTLWERLVNSILPRPG